MGPSPLARRSGARSLQAPRRHRNAKSSRDFGWQLPLPHEQSAMYRPTLPTQRARAFAPHSVRDRDGSSPAFRARAPADQRGHSRRQWTSCTDGARIDAPGAAAACGGRHHAGRRLDGVRGAGATRAQDRSERGIEGGRLTTDLRRPTDGDPRESLGHCTASLILRSISGVTLVERAGSSVVPRSPLRSMFSMSSFICAISRTCDSMI